MKWLIFVIIITLVYVVQQGYFEPKIKEQQEQESALIKEYAETIKTAKKLAQQTADKVEERQKEIQMQIQIAESGMGGANQVMVAEHKQRRRQDILMLEAALKEAFITAGGQSAARSGAAQKNNQEEKIKQVLKNVRRIYG